MKTCRHRCLGLTITCSVMAWAALALGDTPVERGFVDRIYRDSTGQHKYVVFVPHVYTPEKEWPIILFLHGAGERGADGKRQVEVGLGKAIRSREQSFPFVVVFPQCEDREGRPVRGWLADSPDGKRALAILAEVEKTYRTDKSRVYLTGLSMGGFGTWSHAAADPARWAAVVPICGGGDPAWAPMIARLPVWCFHGDADKGVPVTQSQKMIAALKEAGADPKYTEFPGVGHNSWDPAYATDELYAWLLAQRRRPN